VVLDFLEVHQLKPDPEDDCAFEQAVMFGDPETIRMVRDPMVADGRFDYSDALVSSFEL
jgi:hypothetical protein